jgi:hypothetical protein
MSDLVSSCHSSTPLGYTVLWDGVPLLAMQRVSNLIQNILREVQSNERVEPGMYRGGANMAKQGQLNGEPANANRLGNF